MTSDVVGLHEAPRATESWAFAGGRWFWGEPEVSDDLGVLDDVGRWVVCITAEGDFVAARFPHSRPWNDEPTNVTTASSLDLDDEWSTARTSTTPGVQPDLRPGALWSTSLDVGEWSGGIASIRASIEAGDVYQVNLTRRLSGPRRRDHPGRSALALTLALARSHPAPHRFSLALPERGLWVVGASPERFLSRDDDLVVSQPIKGTATRADALLPKDRAENVMICDLVRNDLGRVCRTGTVHVPELLRLESHPGLVHLVTTVDGRLRDSVTWAELLDATFPPGSVTGAPKLAALGRIDALEPTRRGPYCGAQGWVDADRRTADLAVGIRTFWASSSAGARHHAGTESAAAGWSWTFGTGGGITWDSTPDGEWAETELKAAALMDLAEATLGAIGAGEPAPMAEVAAW